MNILFVAALLVGAASAAPDGRFGGQLGGVVLGQGFGSAPGLGLRYSAPAGGLGPVQCGPNELLNTDGICGIPEINRKIYVFAAKPSLQGPIIPKVPEPEVNIDVILVKTPEQGPGRTPIVVPPPEQKTVVYVLSKRPQIGQEVIEVPSVPEEPEVYFVNYDEGENPSLPGGIDLQTALSSAAHGQGSIIGSGHAQGGAIQGGFVDGGFINQQGYNYL